MSLRWRLPWRACAVALAWLASAHAWAGEPVPPPPDDLPMIGESVVTGQPRHRAAGDATASATVISAEEFAGEAKGIAELVSTAPGVAVDDYGGLGQLATASIRGSTASGVLVLLDGIPLQTAFGGGVDLSSIPRAWIDRIEVVRGVEGAHYGTGSLGGVLNVVTARPIDGRWTAEATAGSFGSFAGSGEAGRAIGDGTLLLSVGGERTDGSFRYLRQPTPSDPQDPVASTRLNNGAWRAGALAKATAPVGGAVLDAVAILSAGRRELPGLPTAQTLEDAQTDGRAILAGRIAGPGPAAGLRLGGRLTGRYEWLEGTYLSQPREERFAAAGLGVDGELLHRAGRLRVEGVAQVEGARGDGIDGTLSRWKLSASAAEELLLAGERLRLAPAVRADRDGAFAGLSGKLGASWRLAGPVSLRAAAGRTFRAPSDQELRIPQGLVEPNPDLRPETGIGGDAALLVEGGPVIASLGAHATLYDDLIFYQRVTMGRLKPFNASKALVRGLELEAATRPLLRPLALSLQGSYTLLETEILRGPAEVLGNEIPHRPRHRLYGRVAVAPGRLDAHVEAHYVGEQWTNDRNVGDPDPVPATLLFNAGAALRLRRSPALRVALEVKNLLDDRELTDAFGYPLPGASVWLTVSASTQDPKGPP